MNIDQIFEEAIQKNREGTLTVGESVHLNYLRLLEGKYAGRVIIKTLMSIDCRQVCHFANGLTWIYFDDIKDVRCESVYPIFDKPRHPIDRTQSTWYPDGSDKPQGYEW